MYLLYVYLGKKSTKQKVTLLTCNMPRYMPIPKNIKLSQTVWEFWPSQNFGIRGDNNIMERGSGVAKVSCILHHRGVQLILVYSWARPAVLVADKGRGGMFLFFLFLHFHPCSSFFPVPFFHLLYSFFYLFSPFLWDFSSREDKCITNMSCLSCMWHAYLSLSMPLPNIIKHYQSISNY